MVGGSSHVSSMTNTGASPLVSRCRWYLRVPGSLALTDLAAWSSSSSTWSVG